MDFIPEKSELQVENIEVKDPALKALIKELGVRRQIPGMKSKKEWGV